MTKPKTKLTVADLQAKPQRITITHPIHTDLVTWVEVMNREESLDHTLLMMGSGLAERELSTEELIRLNARSIAVLVTGWDEETFGMEYSRDTAEDLFLKPSNGWITEALTHHLNEATKAFTTA